MGAGTVVRTRTLETFAPMRGLPLSKLNPRGPIRMRSTSDSLMSTPPCEDVRFFLTRGEWTRGAKTSRRRRGLSETVRESRVG